MVLIATDLALTVQRCSLLRIRVSTTAVLTALTGTAEENFCGGPYYNRG